MHSIIQDVKVNNIKMGKYEITLWDLLIVVGGLLAFISFFLTWSKAGNFNITGMDFIGNKLNGLNVTNGYTFYGKIPLLVMLLGIAAIVLGILPTFNVGPKGVKIAAGVVSIVMLVFAIIFLVKGGSSDIFANQFNQALYRESVSLKFGAILAFIASIIATVGGVMTIKEAM